MKGIIESSFIDKLVDQTKMGVLIWNVCNEKEKDEYRNMMIANKYKRYETSKIVVYEAYYAKTTNKCIYVAHLYVPYVDNKIISIYDKIEKTINIDYTSDSTHDVTPFFFYVKDLVSQELIDHKSP